MTDVIITQNSPQVVLVTESSVNLIETKSAGPQGLSAYQVAIQNGFIGTEQQWLDSLTGNQEEYVLIKQTNEVADITINFTNRLSGGNITSVISVLASSNDLIISNISHSSNTVSFKVSGGFTLIGYKLDISIMTSTVGTQSTSIYLLCTQ